MKIDRQLESQDEWMENHIKPKKKKRLNKFRDEDEFSKITPKHKRDKKKKRAGY